MTPTDEQTGSGTAVSAQAGQHPRSQSVLAPFAASARMWLQLGTYLPREDRRRLRQASVAMLVGSLTTAAVPLIVAWFVNSVYRNGTLVAVSDAVLPLTALMLAYCVINGMEVVRHQKLHTVTTGFQSEGRRRIYRALLRWDLGRFRQSTDGALYGRANRSVEGAERLIKLGAGDLLPAVLVAVFAVVLAIVKYGLLGLVMGIVIPTGFGLVAWQIHSQQGIRVMLKAAKERIDGLVSSWLSMLKVIRTTGTEEYFDGRIGAECSNLRSTELRHHRAMSLFDAAKTFNEAVWLLVTLLVAIHFRLAPSAGDMAGIVLIYLAITKPLRELHRVVDESSESAVQAKDLVDDLQIPDDVSFSASHSLAADKSEDVDDAVRFTDVRFQHVGKKKPTLDGISLRIGHGERVGVVGTSGCGKSTLFDLLARLLHGHQGEILLNGRHIAAIPRAELVGLVGYVGQEPMLFPGTIRENLVMGRAGITDSDLDRACRQANILFDILELPNGYNTSIAQKGSDLSGGQRQRLCIARALLCTPPIMLLDEPTSALDGPSQAVVQEAIDGLRDVTVIMVAHRLTTLTTMDRIIVMHNGLIVENGNYTELTAADGRFAHMLRSERYRDAAS